MNNPEESVEAKTTLHLFAPSLFAVRLKVPFTSMLSRVPSRVSCRAVSPRKSCVGERQEQERGFRVVVVVGGGVLLYLWRAILLL